MSWYSEIHSFKFGQDSQGYISLAPRKDQNISAFDLADWGGWAIIEQISPTTFEKEGN